jgi:hypothetical protein
MPLPFRVDSPAGLGGYQPHACLENSFGSSLFVEGTKAHSSQLQIVVSNYQGTCTELEHTLAIRIPSSIWRAREKKFAVVIPLHSL